MIKKPISKMAQPNQQALSAVCVCDLWEKIVPNTFRIGRSIFLNNFSTKSYLKSQLSLCYRKSMHCFPSVNPQLLFYFLTNPLWFLFSQIRRYRLLGLVSITLPYFFISFITMILISLKLLIYLLLVFLELFLDGGIHISRKTPKILLKMLLKRIMKVFLFLMKVLVAVFLMVWILWSIPFSNILWVLHLIFHLKFLICWIIWDVLLCLITDGIKMFLFPEWCSGKIATSLIGKKGLLTICLQSLLIR